MSLFDHLVMEALKNQPHFASLRAVVEKELLQHDILRVMSENNLLHTLTFIGGTCLRCCYGGIRLSEDLDFTGGSDFSRKSLVLMGQMLTDALQNKYGLQVTVSEPIKDKQNVDTWKIKIETRPESKHLPAQRINIDICAVSSYEKQPMMLLNTYGVEMGTSGLIIQAESREEIYTDKLLAFALRPNRLKYRDLWDISWLHSQGIQPRLSLLSMKLKERNHSVKDFVKQFNVRKKLLMTEPDMCVEFKYEMKRFLPAVELQRTEQKDFWAFIVYLINGFSGQIGKV